MLSGALTRCAVGTPAGHVCTVLSGPQGVRAQGPDECRPPVLVVVMSIFSSPQNCLNKQQFLTAIRHLQQLLKGQETRFAEGVRHMKSRLAALQSSVSKAGPETPPGGSPGQHPEPGGSSPCPYLPWLH